MENKHNFDINQAIEILERTPLVIETFLKDLSEDWVNANEGGDSWTAYDVVGHLIHGDKTDWIQRMEIILKNNGEGKFMPFDRFAQFEESKGKTLNQLIKEFKEIRAENVARLKTAKITSSILNKTAIHPHFGEVTMHQLLSTWTAHDLGHIGQIVRVMAKRYKNDAGPWVEYLRILKD